MLKDLWYKLISWTGRFKGFCSNCEKYCKYHLFNYKGLNYCYNCLSTLVHNILKNRGESK